VASTQASAASTERVSVASDGTQGNGDSEDSAVSADGRFAGFNSLASNLVPNDTNGVTDIFVRDRQAPAQTERVSVSDSGQQGNGDSYDPGLSADGRYVNFRSNASNLVPNDTNADGDEFVYDRATHTIKRVSVDSNGNQANGASVETAMSADGRYVAFLSFATNLDLVTPDTNGVPDIFVHDNVTGTTKRVSVASDGTQANDQSYYPQISADGSTVAFRSDASNLVPGDTNGVSDIFVHYLQGPKAGTTERVSVGSGGQSNGTSYGPTISGDGNLVGFRSDASNLVTGDTNGVSDIFVHNVQTGTTQRVSVASDGTQAEGENYGPYLAANGGFIAFRSAASNLVSGDTNGKDDIFRHNLVSGTTELVSIASDGTQANNNNYDPVISPDGRFVVWRSNASNLVPGDTNGFHDVFLRDTSSEDSTAPTGGQITTNLPTFSLDTTFDVAWGGATDSGSGVKSYQVYVLSAPYNSSLGNQGTLLATTSGPDHTTFSGQPGYTYCFFVTVTDNAGNTSGPSAQKCTALPVDDATLVVDSGAWTRTTGGQAGYYQGTSSTSSTNGATLSLAGVQAKRISLVATTCSTCGTVQVFQGGTLLKKVRLTSRVEKTEQVISVANFSTVQTGTVKLVVSGSGKQVIIDGLGVSGT
jgi:WD40-like Beta Propeller Repeat